MSYVLNCSSEGPGEEEDEMLLVCSGNVTPKTIPDVSFLICVLYVCFKVGHYDFLSTEIKLL